jgi:hypothetical protein
MSGLYLSRGLFPFILGCQLDSGEIPWFEGGYTDPWDHTESAMGLAIGGELEAARRAYRWLAKMAYVATGVWHFYRLSGDREFLREMWPVVDRAIGFVLSLQTEHGEIHWAVNASGEPKQDALVTGCSSIFKSLECAHNISVRLLARERLGIALRHKPDRFDRTWESKARYSMDWFYPVLAGVLSQAEAKARLASRWDEFVERGLGWTSPG